MNLDAAPACVLIVDDEPANIHLLASALQERYPLRFATGAARALELVAAGGIELVLLDVVMPVMDGYAVLERLQADEATRDIPVIFVTARDEVEDEERGFALGAVDYITKPISAPIVRARVRTHLELKRQRDRQARHALLDGLTGIANRRCFDQRLQRELQALGRDAGQSLPLGLLLVDVDHFKQYNDHYGHPAGDDCLRRVATALAGTFERSDDLVARFGGEEFAVLLRHGDLAGQARRALAAVRALGIAHAASPVGPQVSISIGAVQAQPDDTPATLLAAVDALLYEAKRGGRDRCLLAAPGGTQCLRDEGHEP